MARKTSDPTSTQSAAADLKQALRSVGVSLTRRGCIAHERELRQSLFVSFAAACFRSSQLRSGEGSLFESFVPVWQQEADLLTATEQATLGSVASAGHTAPANRLALVYEALLEQSLVQLRVPAACLGPSRVWVPVQELLDTPAPKRIAYLRRFCGIGAGAGTKVADGLGKARTAREITEALETVCIDHCDTPGRWVVQPSLDRRRSGAHYTPPELSRLVVSRCLAPLVEPFVLAQEPEKILALTLLDPSMGAGAFLLEALEYLTDAALRAGLSGSSAARIRAKIASRSLFGIDLDRHAVIVAQLSILDRAPGADIASIRNHLAAGDGLQTNPFNPRFFDAVLGNPPWVAYVGRAAQPLAPDVAAFYKSRFSSFRRYRTLHGLFIERSAGWLRPGGRLGLVVPTSTSDLAGYGPTRQAHNELCVPDAALPDFGDGAFSGVFQPCMALLSTRRPSKCRSDGEVWELPRSDLNSAATSLLTRLRGLPRAPRTTFGERGYQTRPADRERLLRIDGPLELGQVPILTGSEVNEFMTLRPRLCVKPPELQVPLRPPDAWLEVNVLVRQTARYPIASLANGVAFRNSIIAGFESDGLPATLLVAWLNCDVVRWFHYQSQRDARQGMPQLKVSHLRALPAPPNAASTPGTPFRSLCEEVVPRRDGIRPAEREELNRLAASALELSEPERLLVRGWAEANPLPVPRISRAERRSGDCNA